jgi:hypothetical protein
MDRAQIDVPSPLADIVGVTDGVSELRPLAADITNSCHNSKILPGLLPKPLAEALILQESGEFRQGAPAWVVLQFEPNPIECKVLQ